MSTEPDKFRDEVCVCGHMKSDHASYVPGAKVARGMGYCPLCLLCNRFRFKMEASK